MGNGLVRRHILTLLVGAGANHTGVKFLKRDRLRRDGLDGAVALRYALVLGWRLDLEVGAGRLLWKRRQLSGEVLRWNQI